MTDKRRFTLAAVDNDPLTLGMLVLMVRRMLPEADVVWTCRGGGDAVARCLSPETRPDVLLVDMSLEDMDGSEVCRSIRKADGSVILVGVTSFSLERYAADALKAGAQCLMDKARMRDVCGAVSALVDGRTPRTRYVSGETAAQAHGRLTVSATPTPASSSPTPIATAAEGPSDESSDACSPDAGPSRPAEATRTLTDREREVMRLCAQGESSREIALTLGIGESSVKTYVMRASRKLGARNRTQAVVRWLALRD